MFLPVGTDEPRPRRKFPYVTLAIVGINVVVFLYELLLTSAGGQGALDQFIQVFGAVPSEISTAWRLAPWSWSPVYSTLLTSTFVHAGFLHIAGNMLYLASFGDNVEDRMGHIGFLLFYVMTGLAASAAQIAVDPTTMIPSVGASGAVAGVLAGYIVLFPLGHVRTLVIFGFWVQISRLPAALFIIFWFVTQFLSGIAALGVTTAETGGVAYWAHIGGFLSGLVLVGLHRLILERSPD